MHSNPLFSVSGGVGVVVLLVMICSSPVDTKSAPFQPFYASYQEQSSWNAGARQSVEPQIVPTVSPTPPPPPSVNPVTFPVNLTQAQGVSLAGINTSSVANSSMTFVAGPAVVIPATALPPAVTYLPSSISVTSASAVINPLNDAYAGYGAANGSLEANAQGNDITTSLNSEAFDEGVGQVQTIQPNGGGQGSGGTPPPPRRSKVYGDADSIISFMDQPQ